MEKTKAFYESKTIQGILITLIATILAALKIVGVDLGFGEEEVTALVVTGFGFIGAILAIYGRVKAQKAIGFKTKK